VPTLTVAANNYDVLAWHGLIAPKGLANPIQAQLNKVLDTGLQTLARAAQLEPTGVSAAGGKPEAFGGLIRAEIPRCGHVVREHHIQV
jgi:tripartite-type tricarboxylate transporter receptor subunit TctC